MKEVASSHSVVGLRTLRTAIRRHVMPSDDDLMFSGTDRDVVGGQEGRSGQYVNIKILNNESFQGKWSAMTTTISLQSGLRAFSHLSTNVPRIIGETSSDFIQDHWRNHVETQRLFFYLMTIRQ